MGVSRRKYGASFKARVALEAIRNTVVDQSIGQSIWDSSGSCDKVAEGDVVRSRIGVFARVFQK
jgi:hypothetical protein